MSDNNKQPSKDHGQTKSKPLNGYARFSSIAFQMIAIIGIGVYSGVKLDEKFSKNNQLFTVILSLVSVALSMYYLIKQVSKTSNKN